MPKKTDHYIYSDSQFESKFDNLSFDPKLFSHEAHLRLAWIHLNKYGKEKAIDNICNQIRKFDSVHGDGTKYHKTITVAALEMVHHFFDNEEYSTFEEFISENPRLKINFKELLLAHYSEEILYKEQGRTTYLPPDRLPFPA
jgi:hypothetical protein